MNRLTRISLMISVAIISLAIISPAIITASEPSEQNIVLQDVDNDYFVDIVFTEGKILWGNQDGSYYSNEWNCGLKKEYRAFNGTFMPVNSATPDNCPTLFMFNNTCQAEADNCIMLDASNLKTTVFEKNQYGTYLPTISINPLNDINPAFQANMVINHEFKRLKQIP